MTLLANAQEALANAPDYVISANRLYQEYEYNEVSANYKYKGKIVLVSGTMQDIGNDLFGDPYIVIGGSGFLDGVQCSFNKSETLSIARLFKGQNVRIKGEVSGKLGNVQVKNCSLQ